jgi:flagellar biosynthetic protein fliO
MRWGKKIFFVFFFLFVFFLFADNEGESKTDIPDESRILLDATRDQNTANPQDGAFQPNSGFDLSTAERTQSQVSSLLRILISLFVVCILAYVVLKFLKKSSNVFPANDPYLKNVASINLAQGKSVHVITLGEKAYIVGVSESSINKIGEVEDKTLIDTMNFEAERRNSSPKQDFASMLASVFKNSKINKPQTIDTDFFAAQRERLSNAGRTPSTEEEE